MYEPGFNSWVLPAVFVTGQPNHIFLFYIVLFQLIDDVEICTVSEDPVAFKIKQFPALGQHAHQWYYFSILQLLQMFGIDHATEIHILETEWFPKEEWVITFAVWFSF